ncbi:delta8-fatty-acid desaturase [Sporothrix schenckii 1099-18]|uniref:Delta8-fatty-acid desaturase n=1 Tax=Sporothrix schenckii 1099-18 TaxID=1397361 RepID=A0A0F2MF56_SPOSC|nr:delta8-fatty-acid desaturase [Sporothrix schenckii 1099-18]KJR87455.1 delta8-fatty-acid desaturase [Sporothrix schenckii 1099-18]
MQTITAYRIGRKLPGPWVAHAPPPIRGGVFRRTEVTVSPPSPLDGNCSDVDGEDCEDDEALLRAEESSAEEPCSSSSSDTDDSLTEDSTGVSDVVSECSALPTPPSAAWSSGVQTADDTFVGTGSRSTPIALPPFLTASGVHSVNRRSLGSAQLSQFARKQVQAQAKAGPINDTNTVDAVAFSTVDDFADRSNQHEVERDSVTYPSVDPARQQAIIQRYRAMHQRIHDAGWYDCPYGDYAKEMARYTTLFVLFLATLHLGWYVTSAVFLGLFWHQIMFTAHDAGHRAITHNFVIDTLIGLFIADFCCGLSIGWWKSSHNVHHLVTNQAEHDPDIQNVPLFATSPLFFKSLRSSYYDFTFVWDAVADYMVPFQKYTYYPIMGIARFNLYLLSWLHVLSAKSSALGRSTAWWIRPAEMAAMSAYWFLFGYCLLWRALPDWTTRVVFVLVSHIITMPLHVQITLSHWGMSTSDLGETESFPQRQLRTTMDVDCPAWLDFLHGGLQFQAVHHLFPRVPRHNLRKVQTLVREFCDDTGIPYAILNFVDGNRRVLGRLQEMSDQVNMMVQCQKHMAATGESGLH